MQRGSMAWKSIWLQIENKPLWGQQSGPTSYYLNVTTCSIQQHGRCVPGGHARCVQQQGSTYGKEWVQMGIVAWSLSPFVAIWLLSHTQLPGAPVVTRPMAQKGSITEPYPLPAWIEKKGWSAIPQSKGTEGQHKVFHQHSRSLSASIFPFFLATKNAWGSATSHPSPWEGLIKGCLTGVEDVWKA